MASDGTDQALVQRCVDGDEHAWAILVRRYQRLVYSITRRYGLAPEDADEVFQDAFLALFRQLSAVRDHATIAKWLMVTTARQCGHLKRRKRGGQPLPEAWMLLGDDPSDAVLVEWEQRDLLAEALATIGPRCQELLRELFTSDARPDYASIAERLAMPIGSIGPTRARCLDRLLTQFNRIESAKLEVGRIETR